jgi:hypothetical protein
MFLLFPNVLIRTFFTPKPFVLYNIIAIYHIALSTNNFFLVHNIFLILILSFYFFIFLIDSHILKNTLLINHTFDIISKYFLDYKYLLLFIFDGYNLIILFLHMEIVFNYFYIFYGS